MFKSVHFICPECDSDSLYEKEVGAVITRHIVAIDSRDLCTLYRDFWAEAPNQKSWFCGDCKWKLPARNVTQLIEYLEKLK